MPVDGRWRVVFGFHQGQERVLAEVRFGSHEIALHVMSDAGPELCGLSVIFPDALVTVDELSPGGDVYGYAYARAEKIESGAQPRAAARAAALRVTTPSGYGRWAGEWWERLGETLQRETCTVCTMLLEHHASIEEMALLTTACSRVLAEAHR